MLPVVPRILTAALLSSVVLAGVTPAASAVVPVPPEVAQPAADKPARYVVRYAPGTDVPAAARALRGKGIRVEREFSHAVRAAVVTLTPAAAADLAASAQVQAVEVDAVMEVTATQQPAPWGLDRIDQRTLPLSGSFTTATTGAGVTAYVVDSGVLGSHAEFGGRVGTGWSAIADGRGAGDCNGHGTHVAGTIAGATYGVAKAATVVPVRVFGCTGSGYTSDVIAGLDWVAGHHAAGTPAVVNLSLGGAASSTVDAALQGVINDGVTAVVAAGNSAADACSTSPARLAAALTVAASDSSDRQASFSNFGSCVDLYAPGASVLSASYTSDTSTATMSGTSMAAPHAAGAAALLLGQQPSMAPAQVTATLNGTATTGVVMAAGTGTPNRLLYTGSPAPAPAPAPVAKAPTAPTTVSATAEVSAAALSWVKGSDGGSALTGQTITVHSGTQVISNVTVAASATTARITGLTAGKAYAFTVTATNSIGSSPASARSNTITPLVATAPAAPTAVKATAGSRSASLSWTKGSDGGSALTSHTITAYSGTQRIGAVTIAGTATTARITGLTAGRTYSFTVTATNRVGSSPASSRSNSITALN
ncbi:serine protease [Arthrobacter sp. NamB2]|uniref:S8 family serine peptidase n=1 Tax=Arthrobacter sp. NamB2 TaxID=2576035 RepID=UPI0010C9D2DC|nr:S8 family serine peptidase [Arthrobacter sp. NamB2]TKV28841.1 serine protease [Arthrobacter sp. NamB2]